MDIAALFGALIPVFFVLFLGYCAGKTHAFDSDQAAGLSKLALSFALPSSLFVGMSMLPRELLASQTKLAFCLIVVHVGVLLAAHAILHWGFKVDAARSLVFSLTLATSATPVFGVAVLSPLLGSTSIGAVGLVALAINCAVPLAVILFEMNAAIQVPSSSNSISNAHKKNPALSGLLSGLRSPLLWAPILGCAVALSGKHLPAIAIGSLNFIGSATSGVAVFAVGLTLSAHRVMLSKSVLLGVVGRISIQSLCLFGLAMLFHLTGPIYREALICCSFPPATTATLLAAKYRSSESESASILLISTLLLAVTIPAILYLTR